MSRTNKQIEAARRNGARSHGPVTPEGKARVAQNGVKHGIYAQTVVLENEDPDLYDSWVNEHLAEWAPATTTEHNLVMDIVDARWRLRRLNVLETKSLDFEIGRTRHEIDETFRQMDEGTRTVFGLNSLLTLNRTWEVIQTSIRSQHRIIDRATAQLLKLGKVRRPLPDPDSNDDDQPGNNDSHGGGNHLLPQQYTPTSSSACPEHANSGDQTRETSAPPSGAADNRESKPEPARIETPVRPKAVFDPTLDTHRMAAKTRLRAA